ARLSDADLIALLQAGRTIRREHAELLFTAGERADAFYFIERGAVEIVIGDAVIRRIEAGECFGERGLDPAGPGVRTAGARTVGPTSLVRVVGEAFRRIAGEQVFGGYDRAGW
ncbi:MAG TPA: cyclic nucleotide-binding domain-containing protein, partial [Enhygromyxa sp.]|nr:cyclic nucleotide-binding domain-containing protein [Enhygromyxa sp.]